MSFCARLRSVRLNAYMDRSGANELFMIADARPKIQGYLPLSSPLYFLYSHTAELALKAFLRAKDKNFKIRKVYKLADFYAESRSRGLVINPRFEIGNLLYFLDSGNKPNQAFRYFNLQPCKTADLSWVREVIPELIRAVEPHVQGNTERRGAKMTLTFSKPRAKSGGA